MHFITYTTRQQLSGKTKNVARIKTENQRMNIEIKKRNSYHYQIFSQYLALQPTTI